MIKPAFMKMKVSPINIKGILEKPLSLPECFYKKTKKHD